MDKETMHLMSRIDKINQNMEKIVKSIDKVAEILDVLVTEKIKERQAVNLESGTQQAPG